MLFPKQAVIADYRVEVLGKKATVGCVRDARTEYHTLKELPQPQDEVAFGFFTWNDEPTISST
jgi:hypothetical protein